MSKVDNHKAICKKLNDLYARKNADYGDSFGKSYKEYGLTMACIRLEDKLNRIKALSKQEAQVNDESITDTLMDMANYAIMTLVELGQGVAEKISEPQKGEHVQECLCSYKHCLCNTCAHDVEDDACCTNKYGIELCPVCECPDYVKEDENANS